VSRRRRSTFKPSGSVITYQPRHARRTKLVWHQTRIWGLVGFCAGLAFCIVVITVMDVIR
jgi:hypothetical protein